LLLLLLIQRKISLYLGPVRRFVTPFWYAAGHPGGFLAALWCPLMYDLVSCCC